MSFLPGIEQKAAAEIKRFQENKLEELLQYLQRQSPFYQKLFLKNGIHVNTIRYLEDLHRIPPTTKDDIQHFNWEFLCVDKRTIAEYTATSGTMGKPVTIALTENDLQRLAYNECISFACAGGSSGDLYQLMLTLDRQFMAGIAYYEGIRKLGASMVRVGPGLPAMQWETIERLKPTTIVAVPSFIVKLIEYAQQNNIDVNKSSVKKAICIGESLRNADLRPNALAAKIKRAWDIHLFSTYASTEMQTAFTECSFGTGGHLHPELIIVELLNERNESVKAGEPGEITITTLGVEAMPLLRYKTGDIAAYDDQPCSCGRTTLRLGPVQGRQQHMIKLKGTTLYPPGVFEIINQIKDIKDYVVEAFSNELGTDELRLHLLADNPSVTEARVLALFQSSLRVLPVIRFATQQDIEQLQLSGQSRKIKKFLDNRT